MNNCAFCHRKAQIIFCGYDFCHKCLQSLFDESEKYAGLCVACGKPVSNADGETEMIHIGCDILSRPEDKLKA